MKAMDSVEREVWQTVCRLNECWTKHGGKNLGDFFHENMVALTPVDRYRRTGRDECVDGWMSFIRTTDILSWETSDPLVNVYVDAAVVTYYYQMRCILREEAVTLSGRDMFFMVRRNSLWLAVADQFSGYPART